MNLSIIVITRNQEWNIRRLLDSIIAELPSLPRSEVIVVDSASTDRTVSICLSYPGVRVLRLDGNQQLSPAAGRYAGFHYSSGQWVLHMDGDTELVSDWIAGAIEALRTRPELAGITGQICLISEGEVPIFDLAYPEDRRLQACRHLTGGTSMYRRSVLDQVGTFNPWLCSEEEAELASRIRSAGYLLVGNNQPCAVHRDLVSHLTFAGVLARYRRNLLTGQGQIYRNYFGTPVFWKFLRERGRLLVAPFTLNLAIVVALIHSVVMGGWLWLEYCAFALLAVVLALALRKRSLYQAARSIFAFELLFIGTIEGMFLTVPPPRDYRIDGIELTGPPGSRPL